MWSSQHEKVQAVVSALSDEYSRKILSSTILKAKSPEEISAEQGIPVSTCYRRIHDLLALSLIQVDKIDLANGKKSVIYRSAYKSMMVRFESNELAVDLVSNNNTNSPSDKLSEMWKTIQGVAQKNEISTPSPIALTRDCDLCQSSNVICEIFVTGDSESYISVCENCEKKMRERNTIKAVKNLAQERREMLGVLGR